MLAVGIGEIDTDESGESLASILARIAASDAGQEYLRVNTHAETLWFNREALEELARWLLLAKTLDAVVAESETKESVIAESAAEWQSVLEAARVFSGHSFQSTVEFILFGGEEQGRRGSKYNASRAALLRPMSRRGLASPSDDGFIRRLSPRRQLPPTPTRAVPQ